MMLAADLPDPRLSGAGLAAVRTVRAVVNAASGSVGPNAGKDLAAILARFGLDSDIHIVSPRKIEAAAHDAVEARPDLLVVLAGDGTAALTASLAGPTGPLIAALPGGTMNLLPHALYGVRPWREALLVALTQGVDRPVSGGLVGERAFYVAAILGLPALFADAREALRSRRFGLAFTRARHAFSQSFRRGLSYSLEGSPRETAEALMLLCPLVSRGLNDEGVLEAAALNPADVSQVLRLGFNTALGRWRHDPSVLTIASRCGRVWAKRKIPAVLDGEPCRLDPFVEFTFREVAFRALAPPLPEPA